MTNMGFCQETNEGVLLGIAEAAANPWWANGRAYQNL